MIPVKIGRYEIKSELGRGGMATVYHAYDPSFDREVAIKVLPIEYLHDPNFQDRFKREIKIIAALEHPSIVPVHDVGEDEGIPYFVMRYMPGGSLTNQIDRGIFSMTDAARIVEKLASALAYAHKKGIIHRDLKPDNILFDSNGEPFISDFGVASFATGPTDLTGNSAIGTPAYMSPEQAQGDKVDSRSDIYGLGVIIFHMLSGQQPYKADTPMGVAVKQITEPVPEILKVNPRLPKDTDTIIKTAMAKNKEDRYPTTIELAQALQRVASGQTAVLSGQELSKSVSQAITVNPEPSRKNNLFIIAALAIVVVVVAAILLLRNKIFPSQPAQTADLSSPAAATSQPAATVSDSFTEDFNGDLKNWNHFIVGGLENGVKAGIENGFLNLEIKGKDQHYYTYYTAKTYSNVSIDVHTENVGQYNNTVTIFCRYNEDKGWYEFNINTGGLYKILYTKWNSDKQNTSSSVIANGGSNLVRAGKDVNEYTVTCDGRNLSLSINGTEVSTVVDNNFTLADGYAGIGIASEKLVPIENRIDSVTFSQP